MSVLCQRTKSQLDAIDLIYREKYGKTLREYVEKETGGNLSEFLTYMQMSEAEFDFHLLKNAFAGLGCNKSVVVEVLCTRSYSRIRATRLVLR